MIGAKEVFCALFRLMKAKGLLTVEEYNSLVESTNMVSYEVFIDTVNKICKEELAK